MNKIWTDKENKFIYQYSGHLTDKQMAIAFTGKFNRTMNVEQIRKQRQRLGIKKQHGRGVCVVKSMSNKQ